MVIRGKGDDSELGVKIFSEWVEVVGGWGRMVVRRVRSVYLIWDLGFLKVEGEIGSNNEE